MRKTYRAETAIDAPAPSTRPAPSFRQEPARAPTVQSDVVVPGLRSIITGLGVGTCTFCVTLMIGTPTPGAFAGFGFAVAATGSWFLDVAELRRLMWRIEERFERDFDGDNQVGQPAPPVDNYIPYRHGPNTSVIDLPEPPPVEAGDRLIRLRPEERTIRTRVLWNYLLEAFASNDWTRDGRPEYINTKEWADVRKFVKRWDNVWETDQRPILVQYLRSIGWTGTNGTERNEPNGG